jgi:hypothetical protein
LVSQLDAGGAAVFYDFDSPGSTAGLTAADGSVLNSYCYLPFGETLSATENIANPFTYVGALGVMAEENGLTFMRNQLSALANDVRALKRTHRLAAEPADLWLLEVQQILASPDLATPIRSGHGVRR